MLLALLDPSAGVAHAVLRDAGVDPRRVRVEAQCRIGAAAPALTDEDASALDAIGINLPALLARIEQSLGADALLPPAGRHAVRDASAHRPE